MKPFFAGLSAPLHISHRGGAGLWPENTLFAFDLAVREFRTDMLELDVHATADGEVVVAHDATLDRCTDARGPLSALTWSQLSQLDAGFHFKNVHGESFRGRGAKVPRLVDILRAFPAPMRFNIEVKTASALAPFADVVKAEGCFDRICIGSEHDALGESLVELLPDAVHFYPRDALASFVLPLKSGDQPVDDKRYTVLDMPYEMFGVKLFDSQVASAAAAHGKWVNVWTVDDPNDMAEAIANGVGGVMTDRPDVLREVLSRSATALKTP